MAESPERFAEWENAPIGSTVTLHSPEGDGPCGVVGPDSLACTRDKGHKGRHVATGFSEVLDAWPGDDR